MFGAPRRPCPSFPFCFLAFPFFYLHFFALQPKLRSTDSIRRFPTSISLCARHRASWVSSFFSMVLGILFNHNDCRREKTFLDDYFLEKNIIYKESFLLSLQFCSPPSSVSLSWCRSCSKSVCPSVCVSFCLSVCLCLLLSVSLSLCLFLGICLNIIDNISLFLARSLPI